MLLIIPCGGCGNGDAPHAFQPTGTQQMERTTALPPTPTRTLTQLEVIDSEMREKFGDIHPDCSSCIPLPHGANCTQYLWSKPITRTQWLELFPDTNFYLVGLRQIENAESNMYGYRQTNSVIAQQNEMRYTIENFDQLLAINNIVVTDTNREQVTQAFALMSLANFLDEDIAFLSWEEGSWPSSIRLDFDHKLGVWTRIQGFSVEYLFGFYEGRLLMARWFTAEGHSGDYIEVPSVFPVYEHIYFKPY
jgi:hypothetical protein